VYRRWYTSTALLGSVSPGVRTLLNHEIRRGTGSLAFSPRRPDGGIRSRIGTAVYTPITNENERARRPLELIEHGPLLI